MKNNNSKKFWVKGVYYATLNDVAMSKHITVEKAAERINSYIYKNYRTADDIKPITGFTKYFIDNNGNIFSTISNRWLKLNYNNDKKVTISIVSDSGKRCTRNVSRLVLEHFVPKTEDDISNDRIYCHNKNGDKTDCYYKNLEWVNREEINSFISRSLKLLSSSFTIDDDLDDYDSLYFDYECDLI